MSDIAEVLRLAVHDPPQDRLDILMSQAADEIDQLQVENRMLWEERGILYSQLEFLKETIKAATDSA